MTRKISQLCVAVATAAIFSFATATVASAIPLPPAGTIVFSTPAPDVVFNTPPSIGWTTTGTITGDIECQLEFDATIVNAFQPCADSPFSATLAGSFGTIDWLTLPTPNFDNDGEYTISVRADFSPGLTVTAELKFSLDTSGGTVSIAPASLQTNDDTPTFTFSTTDSNVGTFACGVLPGLTGTPTYATCTSPLTLAPLTDGVWSLYVRHIDTLGNIGPAAVSMKIDRVPPTITVNRPTPGFVMESSVLDFDFTAVDPAPNTGATLECRFNAEAFAPCDNAFNSRTLADGSYTLEIRATDGAGNVSTAVVPFSVNTSLDGIGNPNGPAKFSVKKLAGKIVGSKYKLKLQGSFAVPKGADPAVACKGKVRFSIKGQLKGEQAKTFLKTAKLKPFRRTCVYSATFSILKAYKGKKLVTRTVFKGNTVYGGFSKTATLTKT